MAKFDSFDRFGIEKMEVDAFKQKQDYVLKKCKCATCKSYVAGDKPTGYCFPLIGTSKNIQKEVSCDCSKCDIFKEYELTHSYYCTRCSQYCQALKTEVQGGQGGAG